MLDGLRRHGWRQIPSGRLVESGRPLTREQISDARDFAAAGGLTIELQRETTSFTTLIDLRTLTATGAIARPAFE